MSHAAAKAAIGLGGYAVSLAASIAQPSASSSTGPDLLAEHWPLLVLLGGGLMALTVGARQVLSLYKGFLVEVDDRVSRGVGDALREHTAIEETRFSALLEGQRNTHEQLIMVLSHLDRTATPAHGSVPVLPGFRGG